MTIDEAIAHELKIAKNRRKTFDKCNERKNSYACRLCFETQTCLECAEEHEQLAEWLEELKDYRDKNKMIVRIDVENMDSIKDKIEELSKYAEIQYNKAIDDFVEKLKRENKETIPTHSGYCRMSFDEVVDEIAEQLKAGGENDNL